MDKKNTLVMVRTMGHFVGYVSIHGLEDNPKGLKINSEDGGGGEHFRNRNPCQVGVFLDMIRIMRI